MTERRCPRPEHKGKRWLPLDAAHYHDGSRWCRACRCEYALLRYRNEHPRSTPRTPRTPPRSSFRDLERATQGWGRA